MFLRCRNLHTSSSESLIRERGAIIPMWTLAFASITITFLFTSVFASGCLTKPTVAQALQNSQAVFAGRVVARLKYGVRFRVERSWKGVSTRYVYIYTGNLRNDLDPWFEKGQRWLVYASDERLYRNMNKTGPYLTRLMSRACNRT